MNHGAKIRTIRLLKGLSQQNLSDMVGISRLAYGDMERGKQEISKRRLEQIANALGVSTKEIEEVEVKVSNFFEKGDLHYHTNPKELKNELEKAQLEIKNRDYQIEALLAKLEKAELATKYWREKHDK